MKSLWVAPKAYWKKAQRLTRELLRRYPILHSLFIHLGHRFPRTIPPGQPWIFARTACLGNDVLKLSYRKTRRFHLQKARIDSLHLHLLNLGHRAAKVPWRIFFSVPRKDVWGLIDQQNLKLKQQVYPPLFILIDSYSELTDQKFLDKKNRFQFYANFSDVHPRKIAERNLRSEGLLDLRFALNHYNHFLRIVCETWGEVPVFLLEYPTTLEKRDKFIERATIIRKTYVELEKSWPNVRFLTNDISEVGPNPLEAQEGNVFPYHFNNEYYQATADQLVSEFIGK